VSRAFICGLLATSLLVTACGSKDPEPEPTPTATASPSPTPEPTWPLTGMPLDDPADVERPALVVKVENTAQSRPQAGLDQADIVIEELVEGGVTRFAAIFHAQTPELIGPVRSARPEDADILPVFDPVFAYSGARGEVSRQLEGLDDVVLVTEGHPAFSRASDRSAPHNLMVDGAALVASDDAEAAGTVQPFWVFDAEPGDAAEACGEGTGCDATDLRVRMSGAATTGWTYDEPSGLYERAQNGEPSLTPDDDPMTAANVVVLGVRTGDGGCCDSAGNPYLATDVVGEGRAIVLRDGRWYEGTWTKAGPDDPWELADTTGAPIVLKPGATWMHLAPREDLPDVPERPTEAGTATETGTEG
jgi:hypothetical protein